MQFVYSRLAEKYQEHHIIVYGRSLGSGFAAKIASDNKPRYLILDSPYYSFVKVVERFIPFLPVRSKAGQGPLDFVDAGIAPPKSSAWRLAGRGGGYHKDGLRADRERLRAKLQHLRQGRKVC